MPRLYKKGRKIALPPGTIGAHEGIPEDVKIHLIDYSEKDIQEIELTTIKECFAYKKTPTVTWINVDGQNKKVIEEINKHFDIHPLVLEDIVNREQRPKIEEYDKYLFFVLKMIHEDRSRNDIYAEQIGLILGENFVISFQEKQGDVFEPIRARLRESKGRIRTEGSDYLAYALLDAIVDHYFVLLEKIGGDIDALEESLLKELRNDAPFKIHRLKSHIIYLRKQIWPLREVLAGFQRNESKLIKSTTGVYLRDVYDHAIQVNDTLEAFRDALSGLHDIYLSSISNRMNEIMKVLTIFAAIFIPLTFIAGVYGMNFENMPELHWPHGYFMALGLMGIVGFGMLILFKIKQWF